MDECFFPWCKRGCDKKNVISTWSHQRIERVKSASIQRGDNIHSIIQELIVANDNNDVEIKAHHLCTCEYIDKIKIKRAANQKESYVEEPTPTKRTRHDTDTFCFQLHCIFCGKTCTEDKKHPGRKAIHRVRTAEYGGTLKYGSFKEAILAVCDTRDDKQSEDVRIRVNSAMSDLHAADALYHEHCRSIFMPPKAVSSVITKSKEDDQTAFNFVVRTMESDQSRVWTSTEVYNFYLENGGDSDKMSKRKLVRSLSDNMGSKLLVLQNTGLASMLMFPSRAAEMVKLVEDESDSLDLKPIAKQIVNECKHIESDECKSMYNPRINSNMARADSSQTVLDLLSLISPKLDGLPGYLIANMITYVIRNQYTSLLLALGVLVRDKALISVLSNS